MRLQEIVDGTEGLTLKAAEEGAKSQSSQATAEPAQDARPQAMAPELPPQLAINSGKTAAEIMADLNKSPLFMTELEENDDIAALQALAYEGTSLENAVNFKEQGNECFQVKQWSDAKEFYGKGVAIVVTEERRRAKGEKPREGDPDGDDSEEIRKQKAVLEVLYVNRAACELELKNYRSAWLDCGRALQLNPKNLKAYYRSAKALLAVGRIADADDACARGLAIDANNSALKTVATEIIKKAEQMDAKAKIENARIAKEKRREMLMKAALKARNIKVRSTNQPPEMEDAKLQLVPDPDDPRSSLSFPTVLLYPVHLETDFIKAFNETESLEQHFGYVFPLPWDTQGVYTTNGVECYMETLAGGLIKVGKKVPLLKVLGTGKVEVVDEVVKIFVVPKAKADAWVQEFKTKKAAELKGTS
ncbi:putative tpr repeat protein [Phaeoacremonium minimum UCRPA7]|uniref:Putative tpr repeat protein n=1 Tax=Phaeoacremonium minimum (strain UCR-PA7) TaxID=1286976 RepID=R8BAS5_PHAM7|nr:putative tpr repeat protein [Phaeoacremonium minimum UCRPA7]EON96405.1 putative tpr repeat protein [Phaeoacremonium minimum UCRPA7]